VNLYWSSDDLGATGAGAGGWTTGTTPGRSLIVGDGDGGVDGDILNILRNQQIRDDHTVLVNFSGFISLGGSNVVIQTATSTSYNLSAGQPAGTTSRTTVNVGTVNNITEVVGVVTMDGGRVGGNPGSHLVLEGGTVFASDAAVNRQTALINTSTVSLNEGGSAGAVTFNVTNDGFVPTDLEINSAIIGAQTSATAASTVTQTGNGVLMFSGTGQNTYSGVTTVNGTGSVLALNKTASGTNYALTGDLVVNNGATVRWDQSNQVNGPVASDGGDDDTDVTLNGGTLLFTNNTGEGGTGATAALMNDARGMGSLTLTGANTVSFIDFSAGGGNQIVHFDASPSGWTTTSLLHVLNWDGIPWTGHLQAAFQLGVEGGNGTKQLIFGNSEDGLGTSDDTFLQRTGSTGSSQVGQIRFINPTVFGVTYSGTFNAIILNTGEVVPYAIPEGGTVGVALAVAAVTGLNIWRRRRRTRPEAN
jgi:autotransporter-associated beta strand protein